MKFVESEKYSKQMEICVLEFLFSAPFSSGGSRVMSKNVECFINGHMVALSTSKTIKFPK